MLRLAIRRLIPSLASSTPTALPKTVTAAKLLPMLGVGTAVALSVHSVAKDYKEAKAGTKKRDPNAPLTGLDLIYIRMAQGDENRRQLGIDPVESFRKAKQSMAENNRYIAFFKEMLMVTPKASEIIFYKQAADLLFTEGEHDLAIEFYKLTESPESFQPIYNKIGQNCLEQNKLEDAEKYWRMSEQGVSSDQYEKLGQAYYDKNLHKKVISLWERAKNENHVSPSILLFLGQSYLVKGKYGKSEDTYLLAKEQETDKTSIQYAQVMNELGVLYFIQATQGEFVTNQAIAIECFQQALTVNPHDPTIHTNFTAAKTLKKDVNYGSAWAYLSCEYGKPTSMLAALHKGVGFHSQKSYTARTDVGIGIDTRGQIVTIYTPVYATYTVPMSAEAMKILVMLDKHKQRMEQSDAINEQALQASIRPR